MNRKKVPAARFRRPKPITRLGSSYRRNAELIADPSSEAIVNLRMTRHRRFRTSLGSRRLNDDSLPGKECIRAAKVVQQLVPFHFEAVPA
jgi:hypothetical protein